MPYVPDPGALDSLTVEDLVRRFLDAPAGQESAYCSELLRRFDPLLRRTWKSTLSGRLEYEDFVQEAAYRLFERIRDLKNPKAFPGYFRMVVHSVALDKLRALAARPGAGEPIDPERIISRVDSEILTGILVRSYLELLPDAERRVLELEFVYDLSPEQIIAETGLTRGGISASKTRGIKRLKQIVAEEAKALEKRRGG